MFMLIRSSERILNPSRQTGNTTSMHVIYERIDLLERIGPEPEHTELSEWPMHGVISSIFQKFQRPIEI